MKKRFLPLLLAIASLVFIFLLCSCQDGNGGETKVIYIDKDEKYGYCEHKWTQQSQTLPNCTDEGVTVMKCTRCGERKSVTIPATGVCEYEISWEIPENKNRFGTLCLICPINSEHNRWQTAAITLKSYTKATCQSRGTETYFCVGHYGGKEYSKELTVEKNYGSHSYETVTESLGDFCYDGVAKYQRCKYCGYKYKQSVTYGKHTALSEVARIDLSGYGYCGGTVTYLECACGCESKLTVNSSCQNTEVSTSTYEDGGHSYVTNTKRCIDCGFTICEESGFFSDYKLYDKTTVYVSDEITLEKITLKDNKLDIIDHQTTLSFEHLGEKCTDGVIVTERCDTCAYEYKYFTKGHTFKSETTHLGSGECGIDVVIKHCHCGYVDDISIENKTCDFTEITADEHFGYDVNYSNSAYKCETCGLSYFIGSVLKKVSVINSFVDYKHVKLCSVKINGETVLEIESDTSVHYDRFFEENSLTDEERQAIEDYFNSLKGQE